MFRLKNSVYWPVYKGIQKYSDTLRFMEGSFDKYILKSLCFTKTYSKTKRSILIAHKLVFCKLCKWHSFFCIQGCTKKFRYIACFVLCIFFNSILNFEKQ